MKKQNGKLIFLDQMLSSAINFAFNFLILGLPNMEVSANFAVFLAFHGIISSINNSIHANVFLYKVEAYQGTPPTFLILPFLGCIGFILLHESLPNYQKFSLASLVIIWSARDNIKLLLVSRNRITSSVLLTTALGAAAGLSYAFFEGEMVLTCYAVVSACVTSVFLVTSFDLFSFKLNRLKEYYSIHSSYMIGNLADITLLSFVWNAPVLIANTFQNAQLTVLLSLAGQLLGLSNTFLRALTVSAAPLMKGVTNRSMVNSISLKLGAIGFVMQIATVIFLMLTSNSIFSRFTSFEVYHICAIILGFVPMYFSKPFEWYFRASGLNQFKRLSHTVTVVILTTLGFVGINHMDFLLITTISLFLVSNFFLQLLSFWLLCKRAV